MILATNLGINDDTVIIAIMMVLVIVMSVFLILIRAACGIVRAIPIIVYHTLVNYRDLSDSNRPIDTTVNLFDAEMRYLYDNGFKVIKLSDLGYDENRNYLCIRGHS